MVAVLLKEQESLKSLADFHFPNFLVRDFVRNLLESPNRVVFRWVKAYFGVVENKIADFFFHLLIF